jgi:chemotaxis protein CheX
LISFWYNIFDLVRFITDEEFPTFSSKTPDPEATVSSRFAPSARVPNDRASVQPPDEKLVRPFIDAVVEVLSKQCRIAVIPGPIEPKTARTRPAPDVAAVVGLFGKTLTGAACLSFPTETYLSVLGGMLQMKFETLTPELEDGAAELLNMVFGQAKVGLAAAGYQLGKSIPTTVIGSSLRVRTLTPQPSVVIAFEGIGPAFYLEFGARTQGPEAVTSAEPRD